MEIRLAENIRALRKQKQLTQEQLAEVLGVTVGAVHKWEAKLSVPELNLIMEMADFFDTSVDVLLGYEMKDNRLAATVQRIKEYRHNKDRSGLIEAEKALKSMGLTVRLTDVIAIEISDTPGGFASALNVLKDKDVEIEYAYAFISRDEGRACVILRVDDNDKAIKLFGENGVKILPGSNIYTM